MDFMQFAKGICVSCYVKIQLKLQSLLKGHKGSAEIINPLRIYMLPENPCYLVVFDFSPIQLTTEVYSFSIYRACQRSCGL